MMGVGSRRRLWFFSLNEGMEEAMDEETPRFNTTTITLSIPFPVKVFLDQLADDGFNRSALMLKLIDILHTLYYTYPQIPTSRGLTRLKEMVQDGVLLDQFDQGHPLPRSRGEG
jgi:hypothetical protein